MNTITVHSNQYVLKKDDKEIVVQEHDYVMEIQEMTTLDHMHARRYREERLSKPYPDLDAQILLVFFYSFLKNASVGDVMDEDTFLRLSANENNKWYEAVNAANPGVLPQPEDETPKKEELEEDLEKKE